MPEVLVSVLEARTPRRLALRCGELHELLTLLPRAAAALAAGLAFVTLLFCL